MDVEDLIECLKGYHPRAEVFVRASQGDCYDVVRVDEGCDYSLNEGERAPVLVVS